MKAMVYIDTTSKEIKHITFPHRIEEGVEIKYLEVEDVEIKDGFEPSYFYDENEDVVKVKYTEKPKSDIEIIKEQLNALLERENVTDETIIDLGTQITDVDLNLIEHILTSH